MGIRAQARESRTCITGNADGSGKHQQDQQERRHKDPRIKREKEAGKDWECERPRQTAGKVQAGGSRVVPLGVRSGKRSNDAPSSRQNKSQTQTRSPRGGKNSKISRTKGPRSNAGRPKGTTPGPRRPTNAGRQGAGGMCTWVTETHRSKGKNSRAVAGQTKGQQTTGRARGQPARA